MQPSGPNPFKKDASAGGGDPQVTGKSIAAVEVHLTLSQRAFGWQLELSPMRAFDALRIWSKVGGGYDAASLLFDVVINETSESARKLDKRAGVHDRVNLVSIADRLAIPAVERFDGDQLVLEAMRLRELVGSIEQAHLRAVCVDGPIEPRDAVAMRRAIAAGLSPLQVEFRAAAAIEVSEDRTVCFQSRDKKPALRLAAECFRLLLAAVRGRAAEDVAAPEVHQVERMLDVSGTISMRAIETDVYSTFVDVGASTATEPFTQPADVSLIYDVPSNTWHDEP
jgi:hypothetical protein